MHKLIRATDPLEEMTGTRIFEKRDGAERQDASPPKPEAKNIMLQECEQPEDPGGKPAKQPEKQPERQSADQPERQPKEQSAEQPTEQPEKQPDGQPLVCFSQDHCIRSASVIVSSFLSKNSAKNSPKSNPKTRAMTSPMNSPMLK